MNRFITSVARIYLLLVSIFYILMGLGGIVFNQEQGGGGPLMSLLVFTGVLGIQLGISPFLSLVEILGLNSLKFLGVIALVLGVLSFFSIIKYSHTGRAGFVYILCALTAVLTVIVAVESVVTFDEVPMIAVSIVTSLWLAIYVLYRGVSSQRSISLS